MPFKENNFEIKEERLHFLVMKESTRDKGVLKCALQYWRMPRQKVCLSRDTTSLRYPRNSKETLNIQSESR